MFCRKCGKEINDASSFCPYCGTRRTESYNEQAVYTADNASDNEVLPVYKRKNRGALVVLFIPMAVVLIKVILLIAVNMAGTMIHRNSVERPMYDIRTEVEGRR